ncbi:PIN domain-containing protein [Aphanothece minutissima]|uniref:PIN domain-containing protein n=1 Tax=Aphanothece minutissima TaxID=543815 RepID=UPI0011B24DFD|nr:PIN domain-containing protein [Aphanothece minutissima]
MLIALDTNVWLKERLLRSATGAALLYSLSLVGGRLLLPDTTRREIFAGVKRDGSGAVSSVERGLRLIQQLTGARPDIALPTADDFGKHAETRLDELSDYLQHVKIRKTHLSKALDRVINHQAPASTSEQYRDCILWECILEAGMECQFVTEDGDFLDKKANGTVLSPELDKEACGRVRVYKSISELLRVIQAQLPHLNDEEIANAIASAVVPEMETVTANQEWRVGNRSGSSVELYATERPSATAAVFALEFKALDCEDLEGSKIDEGIARVLGECMLTKTLDVSELVIDRIELYSIRGDRIKGGAVIVRCPAFIIGTPETPYKVRYPIPRRPA